MRAPSWFQKLRRRRKKKQSPCIRGQGGSPAAAPDDGAARTPASSPSNDNCPSSKECQAPGPAACAVSPNRASYYFPSADRARRDRDGGRRLPCALDVRVDVVHRRAGERLGGLDAPPGTPELKLRPIVTARREAWDDGAGSATTSAATTPSTRARGFHVKPAGRRRRRDHDGSSARKDHHHHHDHQKAAAASSSPSQQQQHGGRRRRWLYESLVVVKASSQPEEELAESMAEMVVANGIRSSEDLEELLACYLALNAAEHHRAVVAAFRRVWSSLLACRQQRPAGRCTSSIV